MSSNLKYKLEVVDTRAFYMALVKRRRVINVRLVDRNGGDLDIWTETHKAKELEFTVNFDTQNDNGDVIGNEEIVGRMSILNLSELNLANYQLPRSMCPTVVLVDSLYFFELRSEYEEAQPHTEEEAKEYMLSEYPDDYHRLIEDEREGEYVDWVKIAMSEGLGDDDYYPTEPDQAYQELEYIRDSVFEDDLEEYEFDKSEGKWTFGKSEMYWYVKDFCDFMF